MATRWRFLFFFSFFLFLFFIFLFIIIFLFVVNFVIHWNETAMGLHVFPIPIPPPTRWRFQLDVHSSFFLGLGVGRQWLGGHLTWNRQAWHLSRHQNEILQMSKWQTIPEFLPGEFQGQRSLASYSPGGRTESDKIKGLSMHGPTMKTELKPQQEAWREGEEQVRIVSVVTKNAITVWCCFSHLASPQMHEYFWETARSLSSVGSQMKFQGEGQIPVKPLATSKASLLMS